MYKVITLAPGEDLETMLNEMSENNWELVSFSEASGLCVFRRIEWWKLPHDITIPPPKK